MSGGRYDRNEARNLSICTTSSRWLEELHFSRAAERLHISQPPLSQQIRGLEDELGVKLFERTKRQVQLTEAGKVFLERSYLVLAQLEQAIEVTQRIGRGEVGRLAIGFVGSATYIYRAARYFKIATQ